MTISKLTACTHPKTNVTAYIQSDGEVFITDSLICDILGIDQEHLDILIDRCDEPKPENRIEYYPELATIGGIVRISGLRNVIDFVAIVRVWNPISTEDKEYKEDLVYEMAEDGVYDYFHLACGQGDLLRPFQTHEYEKRIADLEEMVLGLTAINKETLDLAKTLVAEKKRKSRKH